MPDERRTKRVTNTGRSLIRLKDFEFEADWEFTGDMEQIRAMRNGEWIDTIYHTVVWQISFEATKANHEKVIEISEQDKYEPIPFWIDGKEQGLSYLTRSGVDPKALMVTLTISNRF